MEVMAFHSQAAMEGILLMYRDVENSAARRSMPLSAAGGLDMMCVNCKSLKKVGNVMGARLEP